MGLPWERELNKIEDWVGAGLLKVLIPSVIGYQTCPYSLRFYLIHAP
jgi:hypothetical protein